MTEREKKNESNHDSYTDYILTERIFYPIEFLAANNSNLGIAGAV